MDGQPCPNPGRTMRAANTGTSRSTPACARGKESVRKLAERYKSQDRQSKLQSAGADWARSIQPNFFVTLTFASKEGVSFAYASTAFGRFVRHLRSSLYGQKSSKRIPMFPVVEKYCHSNLRKPSVGTHIHLLVRLHGDREMLGQVVSKAWRKAGRFCGDPKVNCARDEGEWFKDINTDEDSSAYSGYIIKTCRDNIDSVLINFVHAI